jgi:hypothetical protein
MVKSPKLCLGLVNVEGVKKPPGWLTPKHHRRCVVEAQKTRPIVKGVIGAMVELANGQYTRPWAFVSIRK